MRIVVVTGAFYPRMNPPAGCINKFIDHITQKHDIIFISQKSGYKYPAFTKPRVELYTVSNWSNDIRNWSEYKIQNGNVLIKNVSKVILNIIRSIGLLSDYFTYPTRLSWLINKYYSKLVELYDEKPFDVIISVSNPVCAHLASQQFKKQNPCVKWITYSTDPFTYYPTVYKNVFFKTRRKNRNYKTELAYYNTADFNIFTEELYHSAMSDFSQKKDKSICFPYVLSDFTQYTSVDNHRGDEHVKFVYAGALRKEIRNPEYALSVLQGMDNIEFHLYQSGNCRDIIDKYAAENIINHSPVSREDYIDLICNIADINVNIGNNSILQAPSKLFELLSTGKPIVNFYVEKNTQYDMIEKYPLGINIGKETENPREKIQQFLIAARGKRLSLKDIKKLFPDNTIEKQSEILDKVIED